MSDIAQVAYMYYHIFYIHCTCTLYMCLFSKLNSSAVCLQHDCKWFLFYC